jgi:hypothetical protein
MNTAPVSWTIIWYVLEVKELDAVNRRAQKAIGRDVVEVDEAEMTEKDFAKERRKVQKQAKRTENN